MPVVVSDFIYKMAGLPTPAERREQERLEEDRRVLAGRYFVPGNWPAWDEHDDAEQFKMWLWAYIFFVGASGLFVAFIFLVFLGKGEWPFNEFDELTASLKGPLCFFWGIVLMYFLRVVFG